MIYIHTYIYIHIYTDCDEKKLNGTSMRLFRIFRVLMIVTDMNFEKANLRVSLVILN